MDRIFHYQITENEQNTTVLDFLRKKGFSRHILSSMKADKEALTRNGQRIGGREHLLAGDHFRVRLLETIDSDGIVPVSMPLSILYEDEDILVINKPADMPVHPSIGNYTNTLANGVTAYLDAKGEHSPFRCINRLDPRHLRCPDSCQKCLQCRCTLHTNEKSPDKTNLSGGRRRYHPAKRYNFCTDQSGG